MYPAVNPASTRGPRPALHYDRFEDHHRSRTHVRHRRQLLRTRARAEPGAATQTLHRAMKISFLSKYLERIADHATNIAEMVIFMVKGKSIRHMKELPSSV